MAKLVSFAICDSVNNVQSPNGTIITLSAPQIAIRPPFVPGMLSFGLAFGIAGVELAKQNTFRFTIKDPSDKVIQDSSDKQLPIQPGTDRLPAEYQGFMISLDIRNQLFEVEGLYTFSIYLNSDLLDEKKVPVYRKV